MRAIARRPSRRSAWIVSIAAVAAACEPTNGPLMKPGSDCLGCHDGHAAKRWTIAGTIYDGPVDAPGAAVEGATVRITDATGWTLERETNQAGNFYTAEHVAFPIQVCVTRHGAEACMTEPVPSGTGCNACHGPQGILTPANHAALFDIAAASKHGAIGCVECHATFAQPAPASFRCAQCHLARDPSLPEKHLVSTSNPAVVVSDFAPSSDACLRCHAEPTPVPYTSGHPSGFEGTPPHNGATCLVCHDAFRADRPWGGDFRSDPRTWPIGSGHGCLHCHPSGPPIGD
jgi:hypothetical protein